MFTTRPRRPTTGLARHVGTAAALGGLLAACGSDADTTSTPGVDEVPAGLEEDDKSAAPAEAAPSETTSSTPPMTAPAPEPTPSDGDTTSVAPPADEAPLDVSFPESMLGAWRVSDSAEVSAQECDQSVIENAGNVIVINDDGFSLFESGGGLVKVLGRTDTRIEATVETAYADEVEQSRMAFELVDDGTAILVDGLSSVEPIRYVQCPDTAAPDVEVVAPLTPDEAEATIGSLGDWVVPDMSTYDPKSALSAVYATVPGATASSPAQVFLFASGQFVRTATDEPRASITIERVDDATVNVIYGHYADTDPFCCPSLEPWVVEWRADGTELTSTGEIPPVGQGLG
ncbi:MAG: LppP/LprE family lipoprotein [Actinomycetota bacterium]